jgi:hypothetical protein
MIQGALRDRLFRWIHAPRTEFSLIVLILLSVILLVAEPRSLYLERAVVVEDPYRTPLLVELARDCRDPGELAQRVRALGATHVLLNSSEMDFFAGLRAKDDYWSDATAAERELIEAFLAGHLRPLLRTERLLLGEIADAVNP